MTVHEFQSELWLPLPPEKLFPFFADAANLDAITPPWLHFRIVTRRPVEMKAGALIDYRLRVHGLPLSWRTRSNVWQPPHRFEDEQLRGPYRQWMHEHTFEARDHVSYAVPFDFLAHRFFVRPDVEKISASRAEAFRTRFAS